MKLYHATTVPDLPLLKANSHDREGKPVLFLTDNFTYSLFYIRDREIDFVTCGVRDGGIVHYDEKFPDQLKILYSGMSGWVYEVDADAEPTMINGIYVVREDVPVNEKIYVADAFQAIHDEIRKGKVDLYSYENATEADKVFYYEGALWELQSKDVMHPKRAEFYRIHFPEAWEEAQRILDKSLC